MSDYRSPEALAYRHLYKSAAWRKGRLIFLRQHPLCQRCMAKGIVTAATVVNHVVPHKGNLQRFFDQGNWEAICAPHHDRDAQSEERRGYSTEVGLDGFPTDPKHPANRTP